MSSARFSSPLREGVQRLEITTRVTLGVLALASGVYTYLGVRDLLNGNATIVFFAAVIYAVAVSIGIYAFWTFLMRFLPHVTERKSRGLLFGCMALGSVMIIAMSAWLNASALAGAAAIQQHLAVSVQAYTRDLDRAHSNALAAQSLVPDIQMAATRFSKLAEAERGGSLTGTAGSGTVVQLLTQMSTQLENLSKEVTASGERAKAFYEQGGKHLAKMRELVSSRGPINERSDAFGAEAMSLMGVIAALQQTSVAPAVKRAADGLASGFIAPAAGGRGDLADRQTSVVGKVESAVAAQSAALVGCCRQDLAGEAGRARTLPAALHRRSRDPLCRRLPAELGGRDLDRSDAGGAGADLLRGAGEYSQRRPARSGRDHHVGGGHPHRPAAGAGSRERQCDGARAAGRCGCGARRECHRAGNRAHAQGVNDVPSASSVRARLLEWLADRPDDHVLRGLFGVMVVATIAVTALDYAEMMQAPDRAGCRVSPVRSTIRQRQSLRQSRCRRAVAVERRPGAHSHRQEAGGAR